MLELKYPKIKTTEDNFVNFCDDINEDFQDYDLGNFYATEGLLDDFQYLEKFKLIFPKITEKIKYDSIDKLLAKIKFQLIKVEILKSLWLTFCDKWHIDPEWNLDIKNIYKFQRPFIEVDIDSEPRDQLPINIRIGPWTTRDDIKREWPNIERIQKREFHKVKKASVFARDICWYDLNQKYNLTQGQIANLWIENYSEDIDILVMRRIKKKIKKEDLMGKEPNDQEFVEEINNGFLSEKYKSDFEKEKEYYISGQTDRGKKTSPLVELIKQGIRRVKKNIELFDRYATLPPHNDY